MHSERQGGVGVTISVMIMVIMCTQWLDGVSRCWLSSNCLLRCVATGCSCTKYNHRSWLEPHTAASGGGPRNRVVERREGG